MGRQFPAPAAAPTDRRARRRVAGLYALLAALLVPVAVALDGGDGRDLRQALPVALLLGGGLGFLLAPRLLRCRGTAGRMALAAAIPVLGAAAYAVAFPLAHAAVDLLRGADGPPGSLAEGMAETLRRSAVAAARSIPVAALLGAAVGWLIRPSKMPAA